MAVGGQSVGWLFRPGPAGECARIVAEVDGEIVGHAGVANLRFRLGGEQVRGGYSVGAMTAPEMRGRRLFYRMGVALYEMMQQRGYAFVAGFSNAQSVRLMTGPLQRTPIRPFPWCLKLLRPVGLVRALLGRPGERGPEAEPERSTDDGVAVAPCQLADPRIDGLWDRSAREIRIGAVRDADFARWRFAMRPEAHYRALMATRSGEPVAWGVYRTLALRGLRAGFVVDQLVVPDDLAAGRALLRGIEEMARREGAELLSALLPGPGTARRALRRSGFWRVPERVHPQVIRFSVRGLGAWSARSELTDPKAWFMSWADTDVV